MIELKLNKRILLVEVPEDYCDPWLINNATGLNWYRSTIAFGDEGLMWSEGVKLPEGRWGHPIKATEVPNKTLNKIMPFRLGDSCSNMDAGWKDFNTSLFNNLDSSLQAFQSLLTHYSLSPERTILIIEK